MKKTFEELVKDKVYDILSPKEEHFQTDISVLDLKDVLGLLKKVRIFTLQECAKKAKTKEDWWQDNGNPEGFSYTIVDKDSILNLDLNSIEIDG